MGSVPDPRGSLIEPCKLFPLCWRLSCKVRYCGPSVVTVHVPVRSLSVEDDVWEEGRSAGGVSFSGPSELTANLLAGVVDARAGGGVESVTSSGFSNLNSNCVSELIRIWS